MTQRVLAAHLEVDQSALAQWEREAAFPTDDNLRKALALFGLSEVQLLKLFGPSENQAILQLAGAESQLEEMLQSDEPEHLIFVNMAPKVLAAVTLKALRGDDRAAKLFFERFDQWRTAEPRKIIDLEKVATPGAFGPRTPSGAA